MASKQPGNMDLGVIDARRRRTNPLNRNQRRKNRKPRKAPVTTGLGTPAKVERAPFTRKPIPEIPTEPQALTIVDREPSIFDALPRFDDLDHKTKSQIRGFLLREAMQHPEFYFKDMQ